MDARSDSAARELMTEDLMTVGPGDSLAEVVRRLLGKKTWSGVAAFVVEGGRLLGVLSESNALMYLAELCLGQANEDRVDAYMTRGDIVMMGPNVDLMRIVLLFDKHHVHQIPVVDDQRNLLGVVTLHRVLKALDDRLAAQAKEHPTTYDKLRERFGR